MRTYLHILLKPIEGKFVDDARLADSFIPQKDNFKLRSLRLWLFFLH